MRVFWAGRQAVFGQASHEAVLFFGLWYLDKKSQLLVSRAKKDLQNVADLFPAQRRRRRGAGGGDRGGGALMHESKSEPAESAARNEVGI